MKKIRTRYAPSPTGLLHIGGARTALFSYLYAKHFDGDFILRIEDTDHRRSVKGGEASQLNNLAWLGIIPDESPINPKDQYGPYRQSEKLDRYNEIIDEMIAKGQAYKSYESPEELAKQKEESKAKGNPSFRYDKKWLKISEDELNRRDASGEYTIRFALKEDTWYGWKDIVRNKISVNTKDIGDFVIRKMDGYPTYNFAVVIDDHDMEISDVLRGEEHITNTPKQLAIYDALGWEAPRFGHLTIITNFEGKKLSKRDTSVKQFIEDYKNEGYVAYAIFNFLVLLGWTHPQAKEIMDRKEIIESFDPARLSKSPSKFDVKKMKWFSKEYMKITPNSEIADKLNSENDDEWIELFIETYKQSAPTIKVLQESLKIYDAIDVQNLGELPEVVKVFGQKLLESDFTEESIKEAVNYAKEATGAKGKDLFMPIRKFTTYQEHGPELSKAIYLFGKETIMKRLGL